MNYAIPKLKRPVVDGLAFILPFHGSLFTDQETFMKPVISRIAKAISVGLCQRAYIKGSRYRESFFVELDGGSKALVQIGALQPERQKGGIRVVVNPARFAPGDVEQFNKVMRRIVGPLYPELMKEPLLNNVDFAVDILGGSLDRMVVTYTNAQRYTMFCKRMDARGHIEGYNFGSVSSDYMAVVYGKNVERIHAALLAIAKNGIKTEDMKSNLVKQLKRAKNSPDILRVEVRGKKMRGLPLYELANMPNRFERFRFVDLDVEGTNLPPFIKEAFLAQCRQNGVKAARAAFKHTEWVRQVNSFCRSRQAKWWRPEMLWQKACDALREIGLFPEDAFVEPKLRSDDFPPVKLSKL